MSDLITTQLAFDFNEDQFVSLTAMYAKAVAVGKAGGKADPGTWKVKSGSTFIKKLRKLNTPTGSIYKTTRGKNGGSWAHWQIGAAYATYLDEDLHMQFNAAVRAMSLGDPRVVDVLLRNASESDTRRMLSKVSRHNFTDRIKAAGVTDNKVYGQLTNVITQSVLGAKVDVVKVQRGLTAKDSLRDNLSMTELARITLAESMAADDMERGIAPMVACTKA
ncbi:MAG: hypothetical protein CGW95_04920, partial [Phenylobacterium zucineum]